MMPPLDNTYWVVPGKFLAGEYPGHWDSEQAKARIDILEANGVGLFVDLTQEQEPLDPYQTLLDQATHVRMPIVDASIPTPEHMTAILDVLDESLTQGVMPYVHCWGGRGRTGTVVGCWIERHGAWSPAHGETSGLNALKRLWGECTKSAYANSPETPEQEEFVLNWKATP